MAKPRSDWSYHVRARNRAHTHAALSAQALLADMKTVIGDTAFARWWEAEFEQDGGNADRYTWNQIKERAEAKYSTLPAHIRQALDALKRAEWAIQDYEYSVLVHKRADPQKEADLHKAMEINDARFWAYVDEYQSTFECNCNGVTRTSCPVCEPAHTY